MNHWGYSRWPASRCEPAICQFAAKGLGKGPSQKPVASPSLVASVLLRTDDFPPILVPFFTQHGWQYYMNLNERAAEKGKHGESRKEQGAYHDLVHELKLADYVSFKNLPRMSHRLVDKVATYNQREDTHFRV